MILTRAEDFSSKLGQGLSSTAGFLVPGAILGAGARGAAGIAALGGAATGVEQAEDYEGTVRAAGALLILLNRVRHSLLVCFQVQLKLSLLSRCLVGWMILLKLVCLQPLRILLRVR